MGPILLLIGLLLCFGPLGFLIWLVLMLFCGLRKRSQLAQSTGVIHRRRQTRYMLGRLAAGKTSRLEIKLFKQ
jgi:hypothetical protein